MPSFLNPDRRLILDLSREDLEKNLNLTGSGFIDILEEEKVFTTNETDEICSRTNEGERVRLLLDTLQRKTNSQYDKFCAGLFIANLDDIYHELLSNTVIENHVANVQTRLCKYYKEDYSMVDMFAMHDESHCVRLEEIYVPIKWVTYHKTPDDIIKKYLEEYTDIFEQTEHGYTGPIVVRGEPMAGKTTFVRKITHDWTMSFKDDSRFVKLKRFKIVLPIILRLVKPESDIMQSIKHQLDFLSDQDLQVIAWILKEEQERVLFVFDGLDEFSVGNSKEIFNVIKRCAYERSTVIITTRMEGLSKLQSRRHAVEADLEGFSEGHIQEYVKKYFSERKNSRYEELLVIIFRTKDLTEMASNPGRLGILCLLWTHNKEISEDKVQLYTDFVCILLKLAERKLAAMQPCLSKNLITYHKDLLCKFGNLANKRENGELRTVYTMFEVKEVVGNEALKYGFLFKSHPISLIEESEVSFIHKTIQEWLAAFFIANDQNELQKLEYSSLKDFVQDTSLHSFLLSFIELDTWTQVISKSFLPNVFQIFEENGSDVYHWLRVNSKYLLKHLMTPHDAQFKDLSPELIAEAPYPCCLAKLLCLRKEQSMAWVKYLHDSEELETFVSALGKNKLSTEQLGFSVEFGHRLTGGGRALGELLLKASDCKQVSVSRCGLEANDVETMMAEIEERQLNIQQLDMWDNDLHGSGSQLADIMCKTPNSSFPKLKTMNLSECRLDTNDLRTMVECINDRKVHVEWIDFSRNHFRGAGAGLGTFLLRLQKCETLSLEYCQLTDQDLVDMSSIIRGKNINIEDIRMRFGNDVSDFHARNFKG